MGRCDTLTSNSQDFDFLVAIVSLPGGDIYANTLQSIIKVNTDTGECVPMSASSSQNYSVARVLYVAQDKLYYTAVSDIENGKGNTALVALNLTSGNGTVIVEASGMATNETLAVGTTVYTNTSATSGSVIFLGLDGHNVTVLDVDTDTVIETTQYVADRYVDAISANIHDLDITSALFLTFHEPDIFEVVEFVYNSTKETYAHRVLLEMVSDPRNVSTLTPNKLGNYDYDADGDLDILISHVNMTGVTRLIQIQEFEIRDQSNTYFDVYKNTKGEVDQSTYQHVKAASLVDMHLPSKSVDTGIKLMNMGMAQLSTIVRVTFPPAPPTPQQTLMCMDRPAHMIHGETLVGLTDMYGGLCYELSPAECNERAPCHMNVATARCDFSLEHFLRRRERVHSTCTGVPFDFCSQADICVPGILDTDSQDPSCKNGAVNITSQACSIYAKVYHNESVFKGISDERVPDKTTLDDEDLETECPSLFDEDSDEPSPRVVYESSTRRCFVGFQGNGADANSDSDAPCCDRTTAALRSYERIQGNVAINNVALFGTALSEHQLRLLYNDGKGIELDPHLQALLIMWLPLQHLHHRDFANPPSFVTEWRAHGEVDGMITDISKTAAHKSGNYITTYGFFQPNTNPKLAWQYTKPAGNNGESDRFVKVNSTGEPYRLTAGPTFENVRMIDRTIDHDEYAMLRSEGDSDSADGELSYTGPGAEWVTNATRAIVYGAHKRWSNFYMFGQNTKSDNQVSTNGVQPIPENVYNFLLSEPSKALSDAINKKKAITIAFWTPLFSETYDNDNKDNFVSVMSEDGYPILKIGYRLHNSGTCGSRIYYPITVGGGTLTHDVYWNGNGCGRDNTVTYEDPDYTGLVVFSFHTGMTAIDIFTGNINEKGTVHQSTSRTTSGTITQLPRVPLHIGVGIYADFNNGEFRQNGGEGKIPITNLLVLDRAVTLLDVQTLLHDGFGAPLHPSFHPNIVHWYPMTRSWWEDVGPHRAHMNEYRTSGSEDQWEGSPTEGFYLKTKYGIESDFYLREHLMRSKQTNYHFAHSVDHAWLNFLYSDYAVAINPPGLQTSFFARIANRSLDYKMYGSRQKRYITNMAPAFDAVWEEELPRHTDPVRESCDEVVAMVNISNATTEDEVMTIHATFAGVHDLTSARVSLGRVYESVRLSASIDETWTEVAVHRTSELDFVFSWGNGTIVRTDALRLLVGVGYWYSGEDYSVRGVDDPPDATLVEVRGCSLASGDAKPVLPPRYATSSEEVLASSLHDDNFRFGEDCDTYGMTDDVYYHQELGVGRRYLLESGDQLVSYGILSQSEDATTTLCATMLFDANAPSQYLPVPLRAHSYRAGVAYRFMSTTRNVTSVTLLLYASEYDLGSPTVRNVRVRYMTKGLHGNFVDVPHQSDHLKEGGAVRRALNVTVRFVPVLTRALLVSFDADEGASTPPTTYLRGLRIHEAASAVASADTSSEYAFYASPRTSSFLLTGSKQARDHAGDLQPLGTAYTVSQSSFGNKSFDDYHVVATSPPSQKLSEMMRASQFTLMFWTVITARYNRGHWFRDTVQLRTDDGYFVSVEWVHIENAYKLYARYGDSGYAPSQAQMNECEGQWDEQDWIQHLDGKQDIAQFIGLVVGDGQVKVYVGGANSNSLDPEVVVHCYFDRELTRHFARNTTQLVFGRDPVDYVQGQSPITNVLLLDQALDESELASYYNRGQGRDVDPKTVAAWYPMTRNWWQDVSEHSSHLHIYEGALHTYNNKRYFLHAHTSLGFGKETRPGEPTVYFRRVGDSNAEFRWTPSFNVETQSGNNRLFSGTTQLNPYVNMYSSYNYMKKDDRDRISCTAGSCPTNHRYHSLLNLVAVEDQTWIGEPPYTEYSFGGAYSRGVIEDATHSADPVSSNWYYASRSAYKAITTYSSEYDHLRMGHNVTERYEQDWKQHNNMLASDVNPLISQAVNARSFTFSMWMMLDGRGAASEYSTVIRLMDYGDNRAEGQLSRGVEIYLYGDGTSGDRRTRAEISFFTYAADSKTTQYQYYRLWDAMWFYAMPELDGTQDAAQMVTFVMHPNATVDIYVGNMNPNFPNVTAMVKGKYGQVRPNRTFAQTGSEPDWSEWRPQDTDGTNFYNLSSDGRIVFNKRRNSVTGLMAFTNVLLLDVPLSERQVTRLFETGDVRSEFSNNLVAWYPMTDNWWEDIGPYRSHFTEYLFTADSFQEGAWNLTERRVFNEFAVPVLAGNRSAYYYRTRYWDYQFLSHPENNGFVKADINNMETVPDEEQRWMLAREPATRHVPVSANDPNLRDLGSNPTCVSIVDTEFDEDAKYLMVNSQGRTPLANGDRLYTQEPHTNGMCPKAMLDGHAYRGTDGYTQASIQEYTYVVYAFGGGPRTVSAIRLTTSTLNDDITDPLALKKQLLLFAYNLTTATESYRFWGVAPTEANTGGHARFSGIGVVNSRGVHVEPVMYHYNRNVTGDSSDPYSYASHLDVTSLNDHTFEDYIYLWPSWTQPVLYVDLLTPEALRSVTLHSQGEFPAAGLLVASDDGVTWRAVSNWTAASSDTEVRANVTDVSSKRYEIPNHRFSLCDYPPEEDSLRDEFEKTRFLENYRDGEGRSLMVTFDPVVTTDAIFFGIRDAYASVPTVIMELRIFATEYVGPTLSPPPSPPSPPSPPPAPPRMPPTPPSLFTLPQVGVRSLSTSNWYVFGRGDVDATSNNYQYGYKARLETTNFPADWDRHNGIMSEPDEELARAFNTKNQDASTGFTFVYFTILAAGVPYDASNRWGMTKRGGCGLTDGDRDVLWLGQISVTPARAASAYPYVYFYTGFGSANSGQHFYTDMHTSYNDGHYEQDQFNGLQGSAQMFAVTYKQKKLRMYIGYNDTFEEIPNSANDFSNQNWNYWPTWDRASFSCGFEYNQFNVGSYPYNNLILFNRSLDEGELSRIYKEEGFAGTEDPLLQDVLAWYPMHTENWWEDVSGNGRHLYEYRSPNYGTANAADRTFTNIQTLRDTYLVTRPGEKSNYYIQVADPAHFSLAAYTPQHRYRGSIYAGYEIGAYFLGVRIVPDQRWFEFPEWYTGEHVIVTDNHALNQASDDTACDMNGEDAWVLSTYDRSYSLSNGDTLYTSPYDEDEARSLDGYFPLYRRGYLDSQHALPHNCTLEENAWNCNAPLQAENVVHFAFPSENYTLHHGNHTPDRYGAGCPTDLFDRSDRTGWFTSDGNYNMLYRFVEPRSVDGIALAMSDGVMRSLRLTCYEDFGNVSSPFVTMVDVTEPISPDHGWVNITGNATATCLSARVRASTTGGITESALVYYPSEPLSNPPSPPALPPAPPRGVMVEGYFPVFASEPEAKSASPLADAFLIKLTAGYYYMPSGLVQGAEVWYGDYVGTVDSSADDAQGNATDSSSVSAWGFGAFACSEALRANKETCLGDRVREQLGGVVAGEIDTVAYPSGCLYVIRAHNVAELYYNDAKNVWHGCDRFAHVKCVCQKGVPESERRLVTRTTDPRFDALRYRLTFQDEEDPLRAVNGNGREAPQGSFNLTRGQPALDFSVTPHGRFAGGSLVMNSSSGGLRLSTDDRVLGLVGAPFESFTLSYWSRLEQKVARPSTPVLRTVPNGRFVDERALESPVSHARQLRIVEATADALSRTNPAAPYGFSYNGPALIDGSNTMAYIGRHAVLMFNRSVFVEELIVMVYSQVNQANWRHWTPGNLAWQRLLPNATGAYSESSWDWAPLPTNLIGQGGLGSAVTGASWSHERVISPIACTAVRALFPEPAQTGSYPRYMVQQMTAYGQLVHTANATRGPPYRSHESALLVERVRSESSPEQRSHVDFARNNSFEAPLAIFWRLRILQVSDVASETYQISAGPYLEDETGRIVSGSSGGLYKSSTRTLYSNGAYSIPGDISTRSNPGHFSSTGWTEDIRTYFTFEYHMPRRPYRLRFKCGNSADSPPKCPTLVSIEYAYNSSDSFIHLRNVSLLRYTRESPEIGQWRTVSIAEEDSGVTDVVNAEHVRETWVHTTAAFDSEQGATRVAKFYAGNAHGGALRDAISRATLPLDVPGERNFEFGADLVEDEVLRISDVRLHALALNWREIDEMHRGFRDADSDPHRVSLLTKAPVYPESFGASIASHLVDSPEELPFAFDSDTLRLQEPLGGDLIDRLKFAHRYVPAIHEDRAHAITFTLERPTLVYLGVPSSVATSQDVNASLYNQLVSWGGWSREDYAVKDAPDFNGANDPTIYIYEVFMYGCAEAPVSSTGSITTQKYRRSVDKDSSGTLAARARARQYGGYDKQEPIEWYSAVADRGTHTLRCGDDDPLRDGGSHPAPHCSQTVIAFSGRDDADVPRVLTPFKGALVGAAALRNSTPYIGARPLGGDPTQEEPHERDIGRTAMWVYYDPSYYEGDSYYWRTGDAFIDEARPGPSRPHLRESMKKRNLFNPHEHPGALLDGIVSPAFESTTMKPDYQKPHLNERDSVGERVRLDALPDTTGDNRIGIGGYFGFETTVDQRDMTVVLDFDGQLLGASSHAGRRFGLASVEIFNKHHPGQSSSGNRDFVSRVEIHCAASLILTEAGNPSVHDDPNWIPVVHPHVPGSGGKDLLRPVQRTQHINYVSYTLHNNEPTQIDLSKQCDLGAGMRYLRLRFDRVFSSARSHGGLAEIRVWGRELRPRDADRAPRTEASSVAVSPPAATAWRLDCAASGDQWNHNNNPTLASLNEWAVYDETGVAPTSKAFTSRAMPDAHFYSGTWARLGITATVAIPAPMYLEETYADSSTIYWATDGRYNINSGLSVTMTCPGSSIVHTFKSPVTPSSVVWVHNTYAMTGMRVYYASGNLSEPVRVLGDSVIPKRYPPIGFKEEAVSAGYLTTSGYDLGENLGVRSWTLSGVCEQGERRELHRRDGAVENEWYTWRGTEYIVASEFACNEFILTFRDLTTSNMISLTEWALFGSDTVADRDSLRPTWTEHAFYDLGDRPYLPNAPLSVPLNEARPATGARHWTLVIKDTIDRAGPLELMEASFLDDHLRLLQPESTFFSNNLSQSDPSVLHDGSENQNRMYRSDISVNDAPAVYDRAVFPVLLNYTFPADQRPPRYVQFAYDSSEASAPREIEVQFSHGGHYWTSHGTYRTEKFDLHPAGTHRPVRYDLRRRDVGRAARYAHCELPRELAVTMDDESLRLSQQPLLSYLGSMEAEAYEASTEDDIQSVGSTQLTRCALNDAQANHSIHLLGECHLVLDLLEPASSFESSAELSLDEGFGKTAIIYNFSEPTSVGRIELTLADHALIKGVEIFYHTVLDEEAELTTYMPFELAVERAGRDRLLLGPEDVDLMRTVVYVSGETAVSTTALRVEFGAEGAQATTVALEGFRVYGASPNASTPDRSFRNYTRTADERPLVVVAGGHAIFEVTNPERFVSTVVVEFLEDFEVPARWYLESRKLNGSAWKRSHTQIDDARARTAIRIDRDVEQFRLVIDDTHVAARYSLAAFEVYACECGNETNATLPELAVEAPRWILPSHEAPTGALKAALDGSGELQESSSSSNAFIVYNERPIFANEETDLVGMQLHVHGRTGTVALLIVPDGVREDHRASSSEAHAVPTPSVGVHVSDTAVRGVRYWRAFDDESGAWSDTPESEEFDLLDPPSSAVAGGVLRLVVDATNGDVRAYRNTLANEEETADFYLAHHFDDRLAPIEHVHQYRVVMMNLEGAGFDLVDADTRDLYREHSCEPSERVGSRFHITPEFASFECDAFRRLDFSSNRFQCVHFEHTLTRYGGWTRDEATERCVELGGTLLTIPDFDLVDAATFAAELRQAFHDSFRESVLADREHPLYQNIAVEELTATDLSELRFAMANLSSLTERTEAPPVFADVVARVDVASGEWRWELSSADTAAVDAESLWLGGLTPDPMQKPRCAVLREAASNATFDGEPRFGLEATDCESVLTHVACSRAANDATLLSDEGETIAELAPYRPITLPSNVTYAYASVPITVYTNGPAEPAPVLLHARGVVLGCVTWIDANETLALRVMAHRAETRFAVVVEGDVVPTSWRADLALPTNVLVEANFTADRQVRAVFVRASDEISVSAQRAGDNEGGVSCMPLGDKLGGWTGVERSLTDGDANLVLSAFRPGRELNETSELFPFELVRLDELYQSTGKADSRRVYVGEAPSILAGSELNERMQVGQGAGRARFEFNDNATRGTYLLVGCVNNRTDGTFDVAPWIPERLFSTQFVYAYDTRPSIVGALSFHAGVLPDYVDATQQSVRQATTSAPEDLIAGLYLKSYVLESTAQLPTNETLITNVPAAHAVVDGRRLRTVLGSVDYMSGRLSFSSLSPNLRR
ncbi:hypothetical protein CYMTET_2992 [Cymbomonas tetramitiformis]|uniref:Uncharacterized protein n=1 Tax=Cymbomonas tetramitiformis TaxID=36881 RepID=A0AAE0H3X9_9CHLO|nr:hypothetical protein CYMTET_2992 [Cymbomonas tetramitiformis]